jgi:hypothetical protein
MISITRQKIELQRGSVLLMVFILGVVFAAVGASILQFTVTQRSIATRNLASANALLAAEAGIEESLHQLNQEEDFVGLEEKEFFNNDIQGRGVYTTTVEQIEGSNAKVIASIGRVYRKDGTVDPRSERKIRVVVVGTKSEGRSVHSGPGGLILGGSANITNTDVYVNGTITMSGAARIGTESKPVDVYVANIACPQGSNPGPTYPSLCTSSQPISIPDWSSVAIIGNVCATGQTQDKFPDSPSNNNPPQIRGGSGGAGLMHGCEAPPVTPPTYNRAAHKAAVSITAPANSNTYTCQSWPFDRTWPANLQLNGNVDIGGSCNITISGNAYITGNLTIGGAARITVDDSVGTAQPVVMVDGTINVGGSAQLIANSSGTGIHFISFKSSAACSPECTSLSGNDLKTSQNLLTVDIGGAVNLPGMIFQAYWGKARLSGSGSVGALAGQTIDMQGAGTVIFGTELSSGTQTWTITGYQRIYN